MYRRNLLALSMLLSTVAQAQTECSEAKWMQSFAVLEIASMLATVGHCGEDWKHCETVTEQAIKATKSHLDTLRRPNTELQAMDHSCSTRTLELTEAVLGLATRKLEFLEQRLAALGTLQSLPPDLRPRIGNVD